MTLWLITTPSPGIVILKPRGALDFPATLLLAEVLADLIDRQGNRDVVVDFGGSGPLNQDVLEVIAATTAIIEQDGGTLTVRGCPIAVSRPLPGAADSRTPESNASQSCHPAGSAGHDLDPSRIA